ncbi:MAG: hypothetical protein ACRESZ_11545 [Methylococcales bacterium]
MMDFFTDSPFVVELEKDLSSKKQFLDVVILRKQRKRAFEALPDGLDNLAEHNLLSYKSVRQPFDRWALLYQARAQFPIFQSKTRRGQISVAHPPFRPYSVDALALIHPTKYFSEFR